MEDPVPVITRRHFEIGMSLVRNSVTSADLSKYEDFKSKYDPAFLVKKQGNSQSTTVINWGDNDGPKKVTKDEDLDLYS